MSLILKVNSNIINYSLVNCKDGDDKFDVQVFMNLATGAYLLSPRESCKIIAIDDHTFKFTPTYSCNISFACHDEYKIWIKEDGSLTIDENSLLNSVLDIYIDKHVSVINSTIIADTNFYEDCNIVNSFAYICSPVYNKLNVVDERFFTNEEDFEQYSIKPKQDETMIVISGNTFKYCEEYSGNGTIVLRNTNEYSCEWHVKYKYAGIVIYNVKRFHLVSTSCFIKYIVLIGDSNMSISRINLMQFINDAFNELEAEPFAIARNFAENFSKEAAENFSEVDIDSSNGYCPEILAGPLTKDEKEVIRVSMDVFPNAVREHLSDATTNIDERYLDIHAEKAVEEFRNFRSHLIDETVKKLIHTAECTKQNEVVKYHPKHVSTYNPELINVEYSNNVLAGFEYLEQHQDEYVKHPEDKHPEDEHPEDEHALTWFEYMEQHQNKRVEDVDLFNVCDIQTVPLVNVEKGAKLFMLYDEFDNMIYHVNVKSNAIITLHTACYYEEGYITCMFVPNALMKMITDSACTTFEDLSNDFNHGTIYTVRNFLKMMKEDAN